MRCWRGQKVCWWIWQGAGDGQWNGGQIVEGILVLDKAGKASHVHMIYKKGMYVCLSLLIRQIWYYWFMFSRWAELEIQWQATAVHSQSCHSRILKPLKLMLQHPNQVIQIVMKSKTSMATENAQEGMWALLSLPEWRIEFPCKQWSLSLCSMKDLFHANNSSFTELEWHSDCGCKNMSGSFLFYSKMGRFRTSMWSSMQLHIWYLQISTPWCLVICLCNLYSTLCQVGFRSLKLGNVGRDVGCDLQWKINLANMVCLKSGRTTQYDEAWVGKVKGCNPGNIDTGPGSIKEPTKASCWKASI